MKLSPKLIIAAFSGAALLGVGAYAQPDSKKISSDEHLVKVEEFVGTIVLKTGPDAKFSVKLIEGQAVRDKHLAVPTIFETQGAVHVIGDEDAKIRNCKSNDDKVQLKLSKGRLRDLEELPKLEITAPDRTDVKIHLKGGKAYLGDVDDAAIDLVGCGDIEIGNVKGDLLATIMGSGDIRAKNVGELYAVIKGSGDIEVKDVAREAMATIKGSGDIRMQQVGANFSAMIKGSGDIEAQSAQETVGATILGSGDIRVRGGAIFKADVSILGSGDVEIASRLTDLSVGIKGSGDVKVDDVTGELSGGIYGPGDLTINGKSVKYEKGQWQYN